MGTRTIFALPATAGHGEQLCPVQRLLTQSALPVQASSAPHFGQSPPHMPGWQLWSAHCPARHEPLLQSPAVLQLACNGQGEQPPPQSRSVSSPFFRPSAQLDP